MARRERIGLEIGANIRPMRREFAKLAKDLDKIGGGSGERGFLSVKEITRYDKELRKVNKSALQLSRQYAKAGRELEKMERKMSRLSKRGDHVGAANARTAAGFAASRRGDIATRLHAAKAQQASLSSHAPTIAESKRYQARSAFARNADPHNYHERWQQFRANPRMGMAGLAGTAAGAVAGGGLSGALVGVGSKVGGFTGAAAVGAGLLLGTSKKLMRMGIKVGGWAVGQIMEGMGTVVENQMGAMALERTLGGRSGSRGRVLRAARGYGFQMGYTPAQAYQITQQGAMASGRMSALAAKSNMAMMRGYSLNQGTVMNLHSTARHGGEKLVGDQLNRAVVKSFRGSKFARPLMDEFVRSLSGVMGSMEGNHGRVGTGRMGTFMGVLGRSMGGPFAQSPQRVGTLLQQMGAGIRNPQGAKEAYNMAALGGGSLSYHEYKMRSDEGASPRNIRDHLKYAAQWAGGDAKRMADYMHQQFGGSYKAHFRMAQGYNRDPNAFGDANISAIMKRQRANHFKQANEASKRTGMWRVQEGIRQGKAAAAAKNQKNIQDVAAAYLTALEKSTTLLAKFGDALRFLVNKVASGSGGAVSPAKPDAATTGTNGTFVPKALRKKAGSLHPSVEHQYSRFGNKMLE